MVYFIQGRKTRLIKIGYTRYNDINKRLVELQSDCPDDLEVIGTCEKMELSDEIKIHEELKLWRVRREWFKPTKEVMAKIKECSDKSPEYIFRLDRLSYITGKKVKYKLHRNTS